MLVDPVQTKFDKRKENYSVGPSLYAFQRVISAPSDPQQTLLTKNPKSKFWQSYKFHAQFLKSVLLSLGLLGPYSIQNFQMHLSRNYFRNNFVSELVCVCVRACAHIVLFHCYLHNSARIN